VFVVIVGLLMLLLRKNHARVRYWLWLVASVKFLIPFSLLVAIGSDLPWSHHSTETKASFYFAMEEVSQPFVQTKLLVIPQVAASASLIQLLPLFLAVVWLCGFLVVIFHWYFRWRRISAAIRTAVPLQEGREVQALRRLDRMGGMGTTTEILLSRTSLEPGVFGITRPVLLWPDGISERLEDAHLEAILAHELWHVRRRDNLAATIHMVVEAIFWFHPLVWWLGARLLEERERACDEEVLESGSDRQVYAESILKICEFCVGSPLACVSGVTGADLKKRMAYIMTKNLSRKLDFSRKLLLSVAGLLAVAAPVAFGLLQATQTRAQALAQNPAGAQFAYEFVSVKPNTYSNRMLSFEFFLERFTTAGATLRGLIREAYGAEDGQISGAPDWINSERYDIEAKADKSVANELLKLSFDQRVLSTEACFRGFWRTASSYRFTAKPKNFEYMRW
jgi:beta-lactamase regulating signal transducer with metallopeptidase domain